MNDENHKQPGEKAMKLMGILIAAAVSLLSAAPISAQDIKVIDTVEHGAQLDLAKCR